MVVPGFGSMVQAGLEMPAVELLTAHGICSSSVMAIKAAANSLRLGEHRSALVVVSELASRLLEKLALRGRRRPRRHRLQCGIPALDALRRRRRLAARERPARPVPEDRLDPHVLARGRISGLHGDRRPVRCPGPAHLAGLSDIRAGGSGRSVAHPARRPPARADGQARRRRRLAADRGRRPGDSRGGPLPVPLLVASLSRQDRRPAVHERREHRRGALVHQSLHARQYRRGLHPHHARRVLARRGARAPARKFSAWCRRAAASIPLTCNSPWSRLR